MSKFSPLAKLIWATPRGQQLMVYMARVSNPNAQKATYDGHLLHYLLKHQHWSPLEMCHACIEINTTRDIGRQILRHRSFSFQEFSQRYADVSKLPPPDLRETRLQDFKNRQNSIPTRKKQIKEKWKLQQQRVYNVAIDSYKTSLNMGIAKEQARALLPEGLTSTRMYMCGSVRSWYHYLLLRTANGTQKEHRKIAEACREALIKPYPLLFQDLWKAY